MWVWIVLGGIWGTAALAASVFLIILMVKGGKASPSPTAQVKGKIPIHLKVGGVAAGILPDSGMTVEYKAICQDNLLNIGLLTLMLGGDIRKLSPPEQEKKAAEILELAKKIIIQCALTPYIVPGKARQADEVSIHDLSDTDIMTWYIWILELSGIRKVAKDEERKPEGLDILECKYIWGKLCKYWGWDPIKDRYRDNEDIMEALDIMKVCQAKDKKSPPGEGK